MRAADVLGPLAALRRDEVVVTSMSVVRPWGRLSQSDLDFASADSAMGHTADLALGIAMARPERRVLCLNGDGSMLMTLGTLVTIVESGVTNLHLFVIDNRSYEITGNQPLPGAETVSFEGLARAAGIARAASFADAESYRRALPDLLAQAGPSLISVRVEAGVEGPIRRATDEEAAYLRPSLAASARALRQALGGRSGTV